MSFDSTLVDATGIPSEIVLYIRQYAYEIVNVDRRVYYILANKRDGLHYYLTDNQITWIMFYHQDQKVGWSKQYYSGTGFEYTYYVKDQPISRECFYRVGMPVFLVDYKEGKPLITRQYDSDGKIDAVYATRGRRHYHTDGYINLENYKSGDEELITSTLRSDKERFPNIILPIHDVVYNPYAPDDTNRYIPLSRMREFTGA